MKHFTIVFFFCTNFIYGQNLTSISTDTILMGVSFSFTAVNENEDLARNAIQKSIEEVIRIEKLISSWDKNSQTSLINRNAGNELTKVDNELFSLIKRSKKVSDLTEGHFDITFASIDNIWNFNNAKMDNIPTDKIISESISKIGYKKIILLEENKTVFLKDKGMKIGFGAIGKGYAANRVKQIMLEMGINSGVINAGGDLLSWGTKPDGSNWSIGITDPTDEKNIISWLKISDLAVVTSGNYEKYIEIDGKKYCHIINPKTGWPVKNIASVTIICPDAELADALATSVFVLGIKKGMELINRLKDTECLIIDNNNDILVSKNLNKNYLIKK